MLAGGGGGGGGGVVYQLDEEWAGVEKLEEDG